MISRIAKPHHHKAFRDGKKEASELVTKNLTIFG